MAFMNCKSQRRQSVGTFSINSSSYQDWKDATAGNTCAVTVKKQYADSDLIVEIEAQGGTTGTNDTFFLGVNDGTSDFDIGRNRLFTTASGPLPAFGARKFTGYSAGDITFTPRVRCADASNAITFNANSNCCITVYEVNGSAGYAGDAITLTPSAQVQITGNNVDQDVTDGASNPVTVTVGKVSASTLLLTKSFATWVGNSGSTSAAVFGARVDGTTYDHSKALSASTSHTGQVGERQVSGVPAGSQVVNLRARTNNITFNINTGTNSVSLMAIEIPPS